MVTAPFHANGREITLSELSQADWTSLVHYIKYRDYYLFKRDAEEIPDLEPLAKEKLVECSKKEASIADLEKHIGSMAVDVVTEMVWLSARKYHKEFSRRDVENLLSLNNLDEAVQIISEISGAASANPTKQEREGKDAPSPKRKSTRR